MVEECRSQRSPVNVDRVAPLDDEVAAARGESAEELARSTSETARAFFALTYTE